MGIDEVDICPFCEGIFQALVAETPKDPYAIIPHHATFGALAASSQTCALCRYILSLPGLDSWDEPGVDGSGDQRPFELSLGEHNGPTSSGVAWGWFGAHGDVYEGTGDFEVVTGCYARFTLVACVPEDEMKGLPAWQGRQATWEDKLEIMKHWLHTCRDHPAHASCRPQPFLPTRLVSVGLDGRPPRLIHTAEDLEGKEIEYTTLGYCWGEPGSLPLRTTTTLLDEFAQELPAGLIPATFTEALRLTHAMGIPYIWIDALCIIQDDGGDWEREAAMMERVYSGSQLTIAASQSSNSSQGCFAPRDSLPDIRITTFRPRGGARVVRFYDGDVRYHPTDNILSTRAWSLQEHLISPRVVCCLHLEMHWQCNSDHKVDNGLSLGPALGSGKDHRRPWRIPQVLGHTEGSAELREAWENVVENYSFRELTYEHDRMPAFAGILRHFETAPHEESILGLWRDTFARDMGWRQSPVRMRARGAGNSPLQVPLWSWFASSRGVSFDDLNVPILRNSDIDSGDLAETHIRLLSWDVQWSGTPYTSRLKSAYITVRAPAMLIDVIPTDGREVDFHCRYRIFEKEPCNDSGSFPYHCFGSLDQEDLKEPATLLCLLLSTTSSESRNTVHEAFLIIERASKSKERNLQADWGRLGLGFWGDLFGL